MKCFKEANWPKPASIFEAYLNEQEQSHRRVWIALFDENIAGYITMVWASSYKAFQLSHVAEIMDLNVLPNFRGQGIGSKLLATAESLAFTKGNTVGIGVGLYAGQDGGYGAAQRLYVKAGYIPDGKGVTFNYDNVIPGKSYPIDDDLVLWFTKTNGKLKRPA